MKRNVVNKLKNMKLDTIADRWLFEKPIEFNEMNQIIGLASKINSECDEIQTINWLNSDERKNG